MSRTVSSIVEHIGPGRVLAVAAVLVATGAWTAQAGGASRPGPAPSPTVTSFYPANGPVGLSVAITGTGFASGAIVKFNGTVAAASTVKVVSSTSITTFLPSGATTGPISVTTHAGTGSSSASFSPLPGIRFTSFSPARGPVGTSVTITGTGFRDGRVTVKFDGKVAGTRTVTSVSSITATVPPGATTGPITVTILGTGWSTNGYGPTNFKVSVQTVTLTSVAPASGPVGTSVTINGTGFLPGMTVKFNGTVAYKHTVTSSSSITATVPPGATTGLISVTTPAGNSATSYGSYIVSAPRPTLTSFSPASGAVGTTVTITGTGFGSAAIVKFNGTVAATRTVTSRTSITATVPSGARSGLISVTTHTGTATSIATFTVT